MALLMTNRNYRLLFSATAISNLGDGVSALAVPWLATLITRDPVQIALVAAAARLPWFLFALPAGVWTDRVDRRQLMVQADLLRLLLTLGVVGLILSLGDLPPVAPDAAIVALSGLAFLLGSAEVVRDNAAQTVLPSVVDGPALERANGQLWSVERVMGSFIGPPLAGLLIALAVPAPFLLDAVTFGLAAWLVWLMAMPPRPAPERRRLADELAEGWRWMRAHPVILRLAVMLGVLNLATTMSLTILVLFAQEILGLDAAGHGLLLAVGAAGAVAGALWGPALAARFGGQGVVMLALPLMALPWLVLGVTSSPLVTALATALPFAAGMAWNVVTVSFRQRVIPDALLGRVNSIYRFFGWGMMPAGALLGGVLVALAEPGLGREAALRLPFVAAGGVLVLAWAYGALRLRLDP